jgi:dTDP-4-amino-4,6-dideoxygalactose transaminase
VKIPFNKPFLTGKEMHYMYQAVYSGKISGNGEYTKHCQLFFEERYGVKKALLTTSCTDALEMSALLIGIKPGDEVIVPSYTFVSSALAFVREGAKIVFCDSRSDHPGIDEEMIESLITSKTKAIVAVHYAGVACDMDKIMAIAEKYNLFVVEDAAQAIESKFKGRQLGSIGHLGTFSFHETKNLNCGEGGALLINDNRFIERAEIIWEKGTNRTSFFRGEVNKYGWVDIGSSFLPSEINAAFLWAQLENIDKIQQRRKQIWMLYSLLLADWAKELNIGLPIIPDYASNNAHMFYIICSDIEQRDAIISCLKENQIHAVFHYLSLHESEFYIRNKGQGIMNLENSDKYTNRLLRLPFFFDLTDEEIRVICSTLRKIKLPRFV